MGLLGVNYRLLRAIVIFILDLLVSLRFRFITIVTSFLQYILTRTGECQGAIAPYMSVT